MWVTIITAVLPILIKLISMAINKAQVSKEQKKSFMLFVESMSARGAESVRAHKSFKKLHEQLKEDE